MATSQQSVGKLGLAKPSANPNVTAVREDDDHDSLKQQVTEARRLG